MNQRAIFTSLLTTDEQLETYEAGRQWGFNAKLEGKTILWEKLSKTRCKTFVDGSFAGVAQAKSLLEAGHPLQRDAA